MTEQPMLRGRVALVTGGSKGVGKGVAEALSEAGATVYVTGRTVVDTQFAANCIPIRCDHTDDGQVDAVFTQIESEKGRLDVASRLAARQMVKARSGLIVNISFWPAQKHIANVPYGVSKAATDKLTKDMAQELREHGVAVVSLYPGLVRTEKVMEAATYIDLSNSESPQFIGRAVAALAADAHILEHTGSVVVAAACAQRYGFTDVDGKCPRPLSLDDV